MVPPKLTVVTLGARDLPRLRDFYVRLGWTAAIDMEGEFAAFRLSGAVLGLYPLESLAEDSGLPANVPEQGLRGTTLAVNVDEATQVDEAIDAVRAAGGAIVSEPRDMPWGGRVAYFVDPEGNAWEIAWVPSDSAMAELLRDALNPD